MLPTPDGGINMVTSHIPHFRTIDASATRQPELGEGFLP